MELMLDLLRVGQELLGASFPCVLCFSYGVPVAALGARYGAFAITNYIVWFFAYSPRLVAPVDGR
jgi:hypothetical protein